MPDVSFTNLLVVAAVAVLAPLTVGFAPRLRIPAVVLEIIGGIIIGRPGSAGCASTCRCRSWPSSAWRSCSSWPGWRSTCTSCAAACSASPCWALGLLQATSLPFIVTATQIGVALGKLSSVTAAALVCAGLLSVLIFPLIALGLLRRNEPGPAAIPDMTAPVPEPHLM